MHVIKARNVNDAYAQGLDYIRTHGRTEGSRNGKVTVSDCPVTTVYEKPNERVLFDETRDANPFFHMAEIVWMFSGSNDSEFLDRYVPDFGQRYAEYDGTLYGAYGHRWQKHFVQNQLFTIVSMLKNNPHDRRAVLAMWDADYDLGKQVKDIPCNTHIYWRGRQTPLGNVLDMTVCNRSNDIIWGAYGANAVHMSALHEWMAFMTGMSLGRYYQISNNYHAYDDTLQKVILSSPEPDPYRMFQTRAVPMFTGHDDALVFTVDCEDYVKSTPSASASWWFTNVWEPADRAHALYKTGNRMAALGACDSIQAPDWKDACKQWITRRIRRAAERKG